MNIKDIIKIYGEPGTRQTYASLPYRMKLAWDTRQSIKRFQCHELVKDQVEKIFNQTLDVYGLERIQELGLDMFGGCLNVRPIRGGERLSTHSWGLAIDIDPANNRLKWTSAQARLAKPEYDKFWEIVYSNGAFSLGKERNFDWMHFQFIPV